MKNAIVTKSAEKLVSVLPCGSSATIETKLDHLDRVARECAALSVKAALMAGWMLSVEKAARQGTFVAWMEQNLHFGKTCAYRYMSLFETTVARHATNGFRIDCSEKTREEMVEEYAATVESKSLTELYVENGIVKKAQSNLGGRREGAGRKKKLSLEDMAAQAAAVTQDPVLAYEEITRALDAVEGFVVARDGLALLDQYHIEDVLTRLRAFAKRGEAVLAARAKKAAAK